MVRYRSCRLRASERRVILITLETFQQEAELANREFCSTQLLHYRDVKALASGLDLTTESLHTYMFLSERNHSRATETKFTIRVVVGKVEHQRQDTPRCTTTNDLHIFSDQERSDVRGQKSYSSRAQSYDDPDCCDEQARPDSEKTKTIRQFNISDEDEHKDEDNVNG